MKPLEGQVAIVTGSSRGVGRFIAIELAKAGCHVVIAARSEEEPNPRLPGTIYSTAQELQVYGVRALPVRVDITQDDQVQGMAQKSLDEFGRIDILVNNAGIMAPGELAEQPIKRWDLVWRVNVRGALVATQAVLPAMIRQGSGTIVFISSIAAEEPGTGNTSYSATKQALRKIAEGLAGEVSEHGISVFSLSPEGLVLSPGVLYHRLDETPASEDVEAPEEMGRAVVFLASPAARQYSGRHFYSRALLRELAPSG